MEDRMINKKYRVTATVLTPLHIGAGAEKDWVEGVDYIRSDGRMWHLDMQRMLEAGIDVNRMAQMFASGKASGEIIRMLGDKLQQVSDFNMPMPISSSNPIKVFIRNQLTGNPVLAGSSLKGSIRSILFTYLREKKETRNDEVFGKLNDGSDFMRFIRVGDIEFSKTGLLNSKIYDLSTEGSLNKGGWKSSGRITTSVNPSEFNTIYECILPDAVSDGILLLAEPLFDMFKKQQNYQNKKRTLLHSIDALCEVIKNHTLDYIDKELDFFEKYEEGENSSDIFNSLLDVQEIINGCKPNECVLKMSAGSGFHSITGDWQFDDFIHGTFDRKRNRGTNVQPKSRKTIFYKGFPTLMGFVKLNFEEM